MTIKITKILILIISVLPFQNALGQTQIGNTIVGETNNDGLGWSVDISTDGNRIAIGIPFNDETFDGAGKVQVYELFNSDWIQLGNDINGESYKEFSGSSLSISGDGNRLAIGIPSNDELVENGGKVKVFEFNGNEWIQIGSELVGLGILHNFGESVSLSEDGSRLAIGTSLDIDGSQGLDYTRIYEFSNNEWSQLGSDIYGLELGDKSGHSVSLSIDGDIVAIGAPGVGFIGYVHIYQYLNNNWTQLGSNIIPQNNGRFGYSVSLSGNGDKVLIGDFVNNKAVLYKYVDNEWIQWGDELTSENNGQFGFSVSLSNSGNHAAIGARLNSGNGQGSGSTTIFKLYNGFWFQVGNIIDGEAAGYQSGYSVSISGDGNTILVGSPRENAGLAKVYSDFPVSNVNLSQSHDKHLVITPNPTSGIFAVNVKEKNGATVRVQSIEGYTLKEFILTDNLIDISNLKNGVYYISITKENKTVFGKLVKIN